MPRWKPLPDELDPRVRELANRLREIVDHSGLAVSAVADRTGYGKSSWERYLTGRLLPPRDAVVALAGVTGADPGGLSDLWERADRAWTLTEARLDGLTTGQQDPEPESRPDPRPRSRAGLRPATGPGLRPESRPESRPEPRTAPLPGTARPAAVAPSPDTTPSPGAV
ncbi:helix-turn-helix domain-containing protein, partial [Streptomyces lycii]|uniref:helix-turn-helix domain-containing protein n=1 Tax=Streptomyces lycii TaxID=2654337 RepID=UPI001F392E86